MSAIGNPLRQIGVVVRDANAAMHFWAKNFGVGPFCAFRHFSFADFRYRGRPSESPDVTLCVGQSGPLQIEIIQQHNSAPSVYLDFLAAGHEGMQHLCSWYADKASYDTAYRHLATTGLTVVQEGLASGVDVRFAYFSVPGTPTWPQVEISEGLLPSLAPMVARLQDLNQGWDRTNPIIEGMEELFSRQE